MNQNTIYLNKFISESGICSRREADKYITNGVVFVNGKRAQKGDVVHAGDRVRVNGIELDPREEEDIVFIALNKPVGVTSTTESHIKNNIVQYVNHSARIFPIGRLDKDSQGLIFLTNNGDLVNKILRAGNNHEKEYIVTVNKPITPSFLTGMSNGVPILGVMTKKCKVIQESANSFRIILIQGLNRQIRRMCEHFGYDVTKLVRTRIMHIDLKNLPLGDWRDLTKEEMEEMYRLVKDSDDVGVSTKKNTSPKTYSHKSNDSKATYGLRKKTSTPSTTPKSKPSRKTKSSEDRKYSDNNDRPHTSRSYKPSKSKAKPTTKSSGSTANNASTPPTTSKSKPSRKTKSSEDRKYSDKNDRPNTISSFKPSKSKSKPGTKSSGRATNSPNNSKPFKAKKNATPNTNPKSKLNRNPRKRY